MFLSLKVTHSPSEMVLVPQPGIVAGVRVTLCVFQLEVSTVLQHCMNKVSSLMHFKLSSLQL